MPERHKNPDDMDVDALQPGGDEDWEGDEGWDEDAEEPIDSFGQYPQQGKGTKGKGKKDEEKERREKARKARRRSGPRRSRKHMTKANVSSAEHSATSAVIAPTTSPRQRRQVWTRSRRSRSGTKMKLDHWKWGATVLRSVVKIEIPMTTPHGCLKVARMATTMMT